ncbi:Cobalamin synthase [compost metagenome]
MRAALTLTAGWLHALIAALQFLTRLPLPIQITYTHQVFARSVVFYPFAGMIIGGLLAGAGWLMQAWMPLLPASILLVTFWIILTGGLHLDGLMDTADGILSHRPREQMLEIMKDSRVGAMGVIVCVLQLSLKFSLVYTLFAENVWSSAIPMLILVPMWSRWFMVVAIYGWPYARSDSGLGGFFRGVGARLMLSSTVLCAGLSFIVFLFFYEPSNETTSLWQGPLSIVIIAMLTLLAGISLAAYLNRKLGGLTGDTYGALNEIIEVVLLLAVTILYNQI